MGALLASFVTATDALERTFLREPFTIEERGSKFTVATNGHRLIAVPGDLGYGTPEGVPVKGVLDILAACPEGFSSEFSLSKLREFLGATLPGSCTHCDNKESWICDECDGVGYSICICTRCADAHDSECEECDGKGRLKCPNCTETDAYACGEVDHVKIGPRYFNRWVIVPAVRHLTSETARALFGKRPIDPMWIICEEGRVVVMAMRDDSDEGRDPAYIAGIPHFDIPALA